MLKNFSGQPIEEIGWGREVGYHFLSDRVMILINHLKLQIKLLDVKKIQFIHY
jgi:hypothetical protein